MGVGWLLNCCKSNINLPPGDDRPGFNHHQVKNLPNVLVLLLSVLCLELVMLKIYRHGLVYVIIARQVYARI